MLTRTFNRPSGTRSPYGPQLPAMNRRAIVARSLRDECPADPVTNSCRLAASLRTLSVMAGKHSSKTVAPAKAAGSADQRSGPRSRAAGVRGAQIWVRGAWASRPRNSAPAPLDPNKLTFLATATRTPQVAAFAGADANKVAHYMLRWESTRGEPGPWSETASAKIGV